MAEASTILVTGAAGFLGRALIEELAQRKRDSRAAVRTLVSTDLADSTVAVGEISAETDWSVALAGVDSVIHCAARAHVIRDVSANPLQAFRAVNVAATLALATQAQSAGVRRFIFVSSIGVNGPVTHGSPFRADDPPAPCSPYAISKLEAEQALLSMFGPGGMEIVIVRPPLVIGPNAKGNLATLQKVIARGLPLPFAAVTANRRDLVSLEVLCDLLICCVDHPNAAGRIFLVSDGVPLSTRTLLVRLGTGIGRPTKLFSFPSSGLRTLLRLIGKPEMARQLLDDLEVDIDATCDALNWRPERVPPLSPVMVIV